MDDHVLIRQAIKMLLKDAGDIDIIGEAASGEEAIKKVDSLKPNLVIMDLQGIHLRRDK